MKSLNTYLTEGILSNLGIDTSIIDNWINIYNNQPMISPVDGHLDSRARRDYDKAYRDGNNVIVNASVDIIDDNLIIDGYIPDYIHIIFDTSVSMRQYINIYNDSLKSLKGIELDNRHTFAISFYQATSFNDWNTITNLHTQLNIWADGHYPKDLSNFKANNTSTSECQLTVNMLNSSNVSVLDNIKGCVFPVIYLDGDLRGSENKLSNFFKNNVFKDTLGATGATVHLYRLDVNNFNFLLNLDRRSNISTLTCELTKGSWINKPDTFKDMFDGFNNSQIKNVMIEPKSRSTTVSIDNIKKKIKDFKDVVTLDKKILFY